MANGFDTSALLYRSTLLVFFSYKVKTYITDSLSLEAELMVVFQRGDSSRLSCLSKQRLPLPPNYQCKTRQANFQSMGGVKVSAVTTDVLRNSFS